MAVFTDITALHYRDHLSQIEDAFEISIVSIEGLLLGTADSKFVLKRADNESLLVLTIHETPDISPAGKISEKIKIMLRYVDYLAEACTTVVDKIGEPVNIKIPKPLRAFPQQIDAAPVFELEFEEVTKAVSIVPFIKGVSYENDPNVLAARKDARLAGRALGGLSILAQGYPHSKQFERFDFAQFVKDIERISGDDGALESLGQVLSERQLGPISAIDMGRKYIDRMNVRGGELIETWDNISSQVEPDGQQLIHGDFFTDNTMIEVGGSFIVLDFGDTSRGLVGLDIGIALNSWASHNGLADLENVGAFLEGFDSVTPLSIDILQAIPSFVQVGSFRWESFRIGRIDMQDADQFDMLSPVEFSSLHESWQKLKKPFSSFSSLKDLMAII